MKKKSKNIFKKILLFLLIFVVTLYFIGSCTERPVEYKPASENSSPAYTELTPEEYQRQMDELLNNPPVTRTAFKSPVLQAHAASFSDVLNDYFEKSPFYYVDDYIDDWFTGYETLKNYFKDNESYPIAEDEPEEPSQPAESVTVPFQYEFYGKNRVVYKNGTYEIIECRLVTTQAVSNKKKSGHVMYRRTNQMHSTTSFAFDISVYQISQKFNSGSAFVVAYYGLESNTQGLTQNFINYYLKNQHYAEFTGSSVNSLKQFNINSDISVDSALICWNGYNSGYPNIFSISSTLTNDYEFSQSVNNYYVNNKYWKFPNIYYNNHAGDVINQNNVKNYADYGYTYNNITNSIEFDPDVFAGFLDADIIPKLKIAFDDIFSKFPDIDATFNDYTGELNNLIEIYNHSTETTSATGTYPVATGDINVNVSVDVTFPPEFYKTYPALTTEPAFVAENPDIDYALNAPLPVRALKVSGSFITLASDFIEDAGLMSIVLMCVTLGFVVMFFF